MEAQLKALYPEAKDVRHCTVDKLTIVTFPTAEAAAAAASRPTDLAKPVMVMLVSEVAHFRQSHQHLVNMLTLIYAEKYIFSRVKKPLNIAYLTWCFQYLEKRGVVLEEEADRVEKVKTKYENIKNSCVTEEATKIIITDPNPPKTKAKKEEVKKEAVAKKEPAAAGARAEAPSLPSQPILRKRAQRGANVFDKFVGVGAARTPLHNYTFTPIHNYTSTPVRRHTSTPFHQVRGFAQHIKNMGRASDMDVCNYFIHNHKVGHTLPCLGKGAKK